jgi:hypothetical protein
VRWGSGPAAPSTREAGMWGIIFPGASTCGGVFVEPVAVEA